MNDELKITNIKETLFLLQKKEASHLYAILDGALIENLDIELSQFKQPTEYIPLYVGTKYANLIEVSPYLVKINVEEPLFNWWLKNGWEKFWGILCTSSLELPALAAHFKELLVVTDHNNKEVLFRFYDPRVLGLFLDSCSDASYLQIEGPVKHFCLEDIDTGFKVIPKREFKTRELVFS